MGIEPGDQIAHVLGQIDFPGHAPSIRRVQEFQTFGVQRLAPEPGDQGSNPGLQSCGHMAPHAIKGVAHDRQVNMRQMHTDLVGASGSQTQTQVRETRPAAQRRIAGPGRFAGCHDSHLEAVAGMSANWCVDMALSVHAADHDRFILASHRTVLELRHQRGMGPWTHRHDHDATGVLVQTVHDAGSRQRGQFGKMVQQGVYEGSVAIASSRMHHQAGRLVDDQKVGVAKQHLERNLLRLPTLIGEQFQGQIDPLPTAQPFAGFHDPAIETNHAVPDPLLQARARVLRQESSKNGIETLPAALGWNDQMGSARFDQSAFPVSLHSLLWNNTSFFLRYWNNAVLRAVFIYRLAAATMVLGLCSCASTPPEVLTEKEYYEKAREALESNNFAEATEQLEALETYHPFGRYAQQAQLDLIYSRYNALDTDGAAAAAERFIKLHPDSASVDYAYYIKGLSAYYSDMGMAVRFLPVDPTSRDVGMARDAFQAFSTLVQNYPESAYAPDAEQRMIAIRNHLANYEMHVAQYYVRREAYLAALNRAQHIVESFPETPVVADALALMVELYRELGLTVQAADTLAVLVANHPEHRSLGSDLTFVGGIARRESRDLSRILELGLDE